MPDKRKSSTSASGSSPYAKRTRASYAETGDDNGNNTSTYERPRNDPTYGQTSAFPGLEDSAGDELFYGPAEDGIEYLRMVRSEANLLPSIFATAKECDILATTTTTTTTTAAISENTPPEETQQHNQPKQGIYTDGVYIGPTLADTPNTTKTTPKQKQQQKQPQTTPQETYHNLLRHRFHLLRTILNCYPPADAISALDTTHPISLPRHSTPARKEWRRLLLSENPQMVQLACMDMGSVLGVLGTMGRLMSEHVRCGDWERVRRFGAWAWGLLGRCRGVGELGNEEVGEIRNLGKRAVKILVRMREEEERSEPHGRYQDRDEQGEEEKEGEEVGNGSDHDNDPSDSNDAKPAEPPTKTNQHPPDHEIPDADADAEPEENQTSPGANENENEDLEAAKARLQQKLQSSDIYIEPPPHQRQTVEPEQPVDASAARAMLDMIITVVGEYYGQRDLLAAREVWQEDV